MSNNANLYARFSQAWAANDVDGLMALVTDDIVYGASIGPEPGETFSGREAVRAGFARMLAHDSASRIELLHLDLIGDRGYALWRFTLGDGSTVHGIDALRFRDGRIASKQGFRKTKS